MKTAIIQKSILNTHNSLHNLEISKNNAATDKAAAHAASVEFFEAYFQADMPLENIPQILTSNAAALRESGVFGSVDQKMVKRDGTASKKSVASHNHERVLRFFARTWKTAYSEDFQLILKGSTVLRFAELEEKIETPSDKIKKLATELGLYDGTADKLVIEFNNLLTAQKAEDEKLFAAAADLAAADKQSQKDAIEKDAAAAVAAALAAGVDVAALLTEKAKTA